MNNISNLPIIGQEAVVPDFGVGRVISFKPSEYIEILSYVSGYPMKFDPKNVKLVKIIYEEGGD